MKKLIVSDITLRQLAEDHDRILSFREKLRIARQLDTLGFDAVELPEIRREKEDGVIYRTVAATLQGCEVKIPVHDVDGIASAAACLKDAAKPCIQVVLPVSTVQMEYAAHIKAPGMLERIASVCAAARETGTAVEFIAADASRADAEFLKQACRTAEENGAGSVTLCDDAGIFMPDEFAAMVQSVKSAVSVSVFVQLSDAIGMAAACAVSAICAGADGVKTEMTDSGRLSAAMFAEVIRARGESFGVCTGLVQTEIRRGIAELKDGIRDDRVAAEAPAGAEVALGADSTRTEVTKAISALGYDLSDEDCGKVYEEFCRVSARKESIRARELDAIIANTAMQVPSTYHLDSYVSSSGNTIASMAQVTLVRSGEKISGVSTGDGPIDAAFRAIEQVIGHHYELDEFQIQAVTEGREALGSAVVRLRSEGKLYAGNGISTDIVGASIRAYINALNKIVYGEN